MLWPAKVGPDEVEMLKRKLGSYGYSGQYQQRPSPSGGGIFKKEWWRFWTYKTITVPPVLVRLPDGTHTQDPGRHSARQVRHPAPSRGTWPSRTSQTSDYVAGGVWGAKGADRYLLDQVRERMGFPETLQAIKKMSKKWPEANLKLVEDKANGPAVIQALRHELQGLVAVNPDGGKMARAQAVSPQVESGNVYLPHPAIAPWVEAFIEECAAFPNGKYDDQVDQMTQALNRMRAMGVVLPPYSSFPPTAERAERRPLMDGVMWSSRESAPVASGAAGFYDRAGMSPGVSWWRPTTTRWEKTTWASSAAVGNFSHCGPCPWRQSPAGRLKATPWKGRPPVFHLFFTGK